MKKCGLLLLCLLAVVHLAFSQTVKITGVVISAEDNEPVIGASVVAKGTTTGTVTDVDGRFSLEIPSTVKTLVVSFVGMQTQEVKATAGVKVLLKSDAQALDEVMVVAYGTAKKSSFTGSA